MSFCFYGLTLMIIWHVLSHCLPGLGLLATQWTVMFKPFKMSFHMFSYISFVLVSFATNFTFPNSAAKVINYCPHRLSDQAIKIWKALNIIMSVILTLSNYWIFLVPWWLAMCILRLFLVFDAWPQYWQTFCPGKCVSMWCLMMDLSLLDLSQRWHFHRATPSSTVLLMDSDIKTSWSEDRDQPSQPSGQGHS